MKVDSSMIRELKEAKAQLAWLQREYTEQVMGAQEESIREIEAMKSTKAFFQQWWREQSDAIQNIVKELVNSGQFEFITGSFCMHDEAATHYIDMID